MSDAPLISFQMLYRDPVTSEDRHLSLREFRKLGLRPYQRDYDPKLLAITSYSLNHLVYDLDRAIMEAFSGDGQMIKLLYEDVRGEGSEPLGEAETYLIMRVKSLPSLTEEQTVRLFDLLGDVLDDFPSGFVLTGGDQQKYTFHLQPLAIEFSVE